MDNATSHTHRYITIPNRFIQQGGELGGVEVFRLYATVLLNKNWRNDFAITPKGLLQLLGRSHKYLDQQLREQLGTLADNGYIEVDGDINTVGLNDIMQIRVLHVGGGFTKILCVNEEIFSISSTVSVNLLFYVYACLSMVANQNLGYFCFPSAKIKSYLGQKSDRTIREALDTLDKSGYITMKRGRYDPALNRWTPNRYRVHNHGDLLYNIKLGLVTMPDEERITEEQSDEMDKRIFQVLGSPVEYSPCLFKGEAARMFIEYCRALNDKLILTIERISDMYPILEEYSGMLDFPGGMFILHLTEMTEGIEKILIAFLGNTVLPVILAFSEGYISTSLKMKLKTVYGFQSIK
jgi:hypothetical protein